MNGTVKGIRIEAIASKIDKRVVVALEYQKKVSTMAGSTMLGPIVFPESITLAIGKYEPLYGLDVRLLIHRAAELTGA